ncbi:RHS repeat-associated protein [Kribbella voronezhensis]|uniref:RHS repeat-associated protein n=1 Tax=Kribbella voronezhensis TaxID=2512212 RepID=A0A4R7TH78_9ACTN|nr:RHS repeat-associated core domain-containing protein [Kribbella voronezhensis]TDU91614.1 RHS repeat-associated protein [Kribbella voronezhensis]
MGNRRLHPVTIRRARIALATLLSTSVIVSMHGLQATAVPQPKHDDVSFSTSKPKSVSGKTLRAEPGVADLDAQRALTSTPTVNWPKPAVAEVTVPTAGLKATSTVQATGMPVKVGAVAAGTGRALAAASPAKVRVDLLGQRKDQLLVQVARSDGRSAAGRIALSVDYSRFKQAFGADWGSRLRVVQLPSCALTTPEKAACAGIPLPTHNDGTGELSADVTAAPANTLYAVQAGASGADGDTGATSLSPTATWQVGGSSGDFNWNYPLQVPPSLGGPKPDLGIAYSSGSLDGRTTTANNQSSWVGAGFDFAPGGSIERRYASCATKSEQNGNNGTKVVGDLCWATDNAMLSLNGTGGELVQDDSSGSWHPRGDDGTKIERVKDPAKHNGDADGEYWIVTSKDGTKYYFGLNQLPGYDTAVNKEETKSAFTVPVYGNNDKEPCHQTVFADSYCNQAYRWNLDYVVDVHGNTMSLFYDTESNYYSRNATATTVSSYTRAGNVKRIEYGQRDGEVFSGKAVGRVQFNTAERCLNTCTASDYPDTPLDQECTSPTNCNNKFSPTFWTKKRLDKITTEVWRDGSFAPVSSWRMQQTYLKGDNERAGLWLDGISNTGLLGTAVQLPAITFASTMLANRVAGSAGTKLEWPRIKAIKYGTGGEISVNYKTPDCSLPGNVPAPDTNGKLCHPIKWTPTGQAEREDWFNKYVIDNVTESDLTTGNEPMVTSLEYLTPPAWRFDEEDGLVEIGQKTWSQWRGFGKVRVTKGTVAGKQDVEENTYFRGMDGDRTAAGGVKTETVEDSNHVKLADLNPLSGQRREQIVYDGTAIADRSITDEWVSAPTATRVRPWGTTSSYQVQEKKTWQEQVVSGGTRKSASTNVYAEKNDPDGVPVGVLKQTSDQGDLATAADDSCTTFTYAANPAKGLSEVIVRKRTVSVTCDQPATNAQVLADELTGYDNAAAGTVVRGDQTSKQRLSGFTPDGAPTYQTVTTSSYDAYGRVESTKDAVGNESKVQYVPATGPVTATKVIQPNGQTSTTEVDPGNGLTTAVTDPAGRRTVTAHDGLGRVTKIWQPGRTTSQTPNTEYQYLVRTDGAGVVTTKTLKADGVGVDTSYELQDGLMRKIQTQAPSKDGVGRLITDYVYDSKGLQSKQNGPFYNEAPPGTDYFEPNEEELPAQKVTEYDNQDRPVKESFVSEDQVQWSVDHLNGADRQTIDPPTGEQATTRINDVQGRMIEQRQYLGDSATGPYDSTFYTYHPAGQLATVKDPAGNLWKFDYDVRGRKIRSQDPDTGVTTYEYNDLDQVVSQKDGRGTVLSYSYDNAGRKTAVYKGLVQTAANMLSEWKYDSIKPGSLTSSTRYVNGNAYTTRVTGYSEADGKPTGTELVIPASEGALAGTYPIGKTYTPDGQLDTTSVPAVGGLPKEDLKVGYNAQNQPSTLTGADTYITQTSYTAFGETSGITMSRNGQPVQQVFDYDEVTRRLSRAVTKSETKKYADLNYTYDAAGNITQLTDVAAESSGESDDTQCFGYDAFRRMTQAWTPADGNCAAAPDKAKLGGPAPYWHSWTFDKSGNRKTETRTTATGATTSTYSYPTNGVQPHSLLKVTNGANTNQYTYDAAGNLKTRTLNDAGETSTFDDEGHLSTVVAGSKSTSYLYDADGNRLIRRDPTGTTLYLDGTELLMKPDKTVVGTRYYSYGGQTVAVRKGASDLSWLSTDNHGTANLSIDATTLVGQKRRSTPYGELRGAVPASWPGQRGFVGGTNDDSTGLTHLGAREYDPTIGRFISVDPVADFNDPQQLNGYAYANNNPVSFSDADGQRTVTETITVMKTVTYVITKRIVEYQKVRILVHAWVAVLGALATMAKALGMYALGAVLGAYKAHYETVEKKIVRIIHQLVKQLIRVVKKIQRYVGPDEREDLNQMMKAATSLTDPSQGANSLWKMSALLDDFANASHKWAVAAKVITDQPKGGGGGASGGGEPDPYGGASIHGQDPGEDSDDKATAMILGGMGGGALALLCLPAAIACGAAAAITVGIGGAGLGAWTGNATFNYVNGADGKAHWERLWAPHVLNTGFLEWWLKVNAPLPQRPDADPNQPCKHIYAMGAGC